MPAFRPPPRALVNLLLGGALLRLIGLGIHPLWLDEGATWSWATRPTWGGTVLAEANHPPAWWIVTRLWVGAFGDTEASLRAPAAILGIVSIWLAWLLGRRLLDPASRPSRGGFDRTPDDGRGARHALWFAGFVAVSTYFTEYAQDARMYAALIAQALGLALLYLRWLDKGDRASLVGYALLAALALYTQYFAIWIIAAHVAHAFWVGWLGRGKQKRVALRPFLLAVVAAGLLFLPWFLYLVRNYQGISTGEPFSPFSRLGYVLWRVGVGPGLVVVDRLRLDQGIGGVLAEEWPTAVWTGLIWLSAVASGIVWLRRCSGVARFVAANLLVPVVLLLAVFPFFALIHERYLVFLAPYLWLLATAGALGARGWSRTLLVGGLLLLSAAGLLAYHGVGIALTPTGSPQALGEARVPQSYEPHPDDPLNVLHHGHPFGKEPWRQAHHFVQKRAQTGEDGDLVLLHPEYLHLVWDFYGRRELERIKLPREAISAAEVERRWGETLAKRTRVFLVLAHEETEDRDYYFTCLRDVLARLWSREGFTRFQIVKPILFNRSWGVRVAVFNRR